tara:strand:+ start:8428 stop:8550 length:123 start_codon:yes stop_codon:yes gene_type:complete
MMHLLVVNFEIPKDTRYYAGKIDRGFRGEGIPALAAERLR